MSIVCVSQILLWFWLLICTHVLFLWKLPFWILDFNFSFDFSSVFLINVLYMKGAYAYGLGTILMFVA